MFEKITGFIRHNKELLTLLVLAPAIPELLTGSTPFYVFINPFNLLILVIIYGFSAVLVRDYSVKHGLGYGSVMLLGLLVGFLVEGLAVNTFYDPRVEKVDDFATYGRFLGVNWCWLFYLAFFHSIFSVLAPIMLVEAIYPDINGKTLVGSKGHKYMLLAVALVTILFNFSEDVYKPPIYYQLVLLVFMITYMYIAHKIVIKNYRPSLGFLERIKYPFKLLILYPLVFVLLAFFIASKILPPIIHILLGIILYLALYNTVRGIEDRGSIKSWLASSRLTLGLCITGYLTAIFDQQYHIIVPATLFVIILLIKNRTMNIAQPKNIAIAHN